MSKHSIRSGAIGQVERVLQGVEGAGPGVVVRRPLEPVADELLLRVLGHRRLQAPLDPGSPAAAHHYLHRLVAAAASPSQCS